MHFAPACGMIEGRDGTMFLGLLTATWPAEHRAETDESDAALVAAAQAGEAEAFAALHRRYYSRIYRLAYLKTSNAQDAEDVAGETFVRALAHLPRFRLKAAPGQENPSLYPWLHRIALNLIVDGNRQRPPAGIVSLDAPVIEGMRDLLSERLSGTASLSPQEIVERQEVQQMVRGAIAALPADQGEALIYRFLGELSLREIAPLVGRSESAAKSLLHRATVALRAELQRRLDAVERLENCRDGRGQSSDREREAHGGGTLAARRTRG